MSDFPYLVAKFSLRGKLELRTGMHIGGGDVGLAIGGADKLVVRAPHNDAPYIPGSSLKGKIRSILERAGFAKGFARNLGNELKAPPCNCGNADCIVCKVFGVAADVRAPKPSGSTRLIVRDGHLLNGDEIEKWRHLDMHYTEVKTEVSIDRLTSAANPRNFERVPAGACFDLDLVLNIHQGDSEKELLKLVFDGLELLSYDYLGGQGTRGYGAVKIQIEKVRRLTIEDLKSETGENWADYKDVPWTTRPLG